MNKVGRVSFIAVALIVVLRIAIGWQLFYEGVWKIKTLKSATPWTAAGYLKNSQGPLRGMFRNMAGDPDDLDWLDADKVIAKWDDWQKRFGAHYKLNGDQTSRLNRLLNGSSEYSVKLPAGVLPDGVDLSSQEVRISAKEVVPVLTHNREKGTLVVRGDARLDTQGETEAD